MGVWILAGMALLVALMSFAAVRRVSRRLDALNQSYWELRYDYTRLRARVAELDPDQAPPMPEPAQPATVSFVPLSAIRKKEL